MGREKRENYLFKFSFIFFQISLLDSFLFIVFSTLSFLVFSLPISSLLSSRFLSSLFSLPVSSLRSFRFLSSRFLSSLFPFSLFSLLSPRFLSSLFPFPLFSLLFSLFQSSLSPFSLFSLPLVHNRSPLRLRKINNSHNYRHSS